ncbi:MAG: hypothetical protein GY775_11865, partial [Candidatus Scalindua sp.]|nr:hypothetical protein [Candidatus Scalindua sp.]
LHGTQNWGINAFNNYAGETPKHYIIPVGRYFTDNMQYMVFVNDHDVGNPTAESVFFNIRVYEIPPLANDIVNFNTKPTQSYDSSQDLGPQVLSVEDGGATLRVTGNAWKSIDFTYNITLDTVLEFDFQSSDEGEIQGIGFDTNNQAIDVNKIFRLHGTQNWGINAFNNYAGETLKHYIIPVGHYFTGNMQYMSFANDHDVVNSTAESVFSNIRVYEN